ncbi:TPA: hypothetical protein CPT81_01485 [Candidatus Gastranaerophilales bacterium HUM_20]|nr:unknown [Clostridium sp. CAG:729]DAB24408.1 MAG TPA: hypothetical protein CPT81_01485 [Candidatus Gastranaerophilales bacterium HUM_20]
MNKINLSLLVTFLLLTVSGAQVVADNLLYAEAKSIVDAPKWTDFCEAGYENAKINRNRDFLNVFSFVKSERIKQTYWAERRESFEKRLKYCTSLDEPDKSVCYTELRSEEKNNNDLYSQKRKELLYESNIRLNSH